MELLIFSFIFVLVIVSCFAIHIERIESKRLKSYKKEEESLVSDMKISFACLEYDKHLKLQRASHDVYNFPFSKLLTSVDKYPGLKCEVYRYHVMISNDTGTYRIILMDTLDMRR